MEQLPQPTPEEDSRYLDKATGFMPGQEMWQELPAYIRLQNMGIDALPFLINELMKEVKNDDVANRENLPRSRWWRIELISTIAYNYGLTIQFIPESLEKYDAIKAQTIAWGQTRGLVSD
jgi:hypothetical protein